VICFAIIGTVTGLLSIHCQLFSILANVYSANACPV